METQQVVQIQELKAERVQQELAAAEPCRSRSRQSGSRSRSSPQSERGADVLSLRAVPRNERLVHFKMAPLRKRSSSQAVVVVKLPDGEASGNTPGASASPPAKPVA